MAAARESEYWSRIRKIQRRLFGRGNGRGQDNGRGRGRGRGAGPPGARGRGDETGWGGNRGRGRGAGPPGARGRGDGTGWGGNRGRGRGAGPPGARGRGDETGWGGDRGRGRGAGPPGARGRGDETGWGGNRGRGRGAGPPGARGRGNDTGWGGNRGRGRGENVMRHATRGGNGRSRGGPLGRGRVGHRERNRDPNEPVAPMGSRRMTALLDNSDEVILLDLKDIFKGFKEELDQSQAHDRERFGLPLLLLGRAVTCNKFPETLTQLLVMVRSATWLTRLPTFLQGIHDFQGNNLEYLKNAMTLLKLVLSKMPSALDVIHPIFFSVEYIIKRCDVPVDIKKKFDCSFIEIQQLIDNIERKQSEKKKAGISGHEDFFRPPESFLELSILPTENDLHTQKKPFLRVNKAEGHYQDLSHYLDVQFRLLRADFVGPLHAGIQAYMESKADKVPRKSAFQDIRVYENVRIIGPVCCRRGIAYRIRFDLTRLPNIQWQNTKRLLFGSLVCLTLDNFNTVFFGTVANREINDMQKGELDIYIEGHQRAFTQLDYSEELVMVESSAFFEAYRPVLLGLKKILDSGLSMAEYIVECDMQVKAPGYLNNNMYDMSALTGSSAHCKVPVLQKERWPLKDDFKLNQSQYVALQKALMQEFALIQGPPGTGKTFIGLKIAQVLLANKSKILSLRERPILVVCYTNHALDQFLEGITEFQKDKIVRIGSRSQSEKLRQFRLPEVRKRFSESTRLGNGYRHQARALYEEMEKTEDEVERCTAIITAVGKSILSPNQFTNIASQEHLDQLQDIRPYKWAIREWLGQGNMALHHVRLEPEPPAVEVEEQDEMIEAEEEGDVLNRLRQLDVDDEVKKGKCIKERAALHAMEILGIENEDQQKQINNNGWQITDVERRRRKKELRRRLAVTDAMTDKEADNVMNIWSLDIHDRWRLYHYWLRRFRQNKREETQRMATRYHEAAQRLDEIHKQTELEVMKRMDVIGMTTTGAARYQDVIQQLAPPIVIIEEAAEVLEAHVVTALHAKCKHVIMIGDHKQLRPNPTVYELALKYNLDLSLFERMINNGLDCVTLTTQHRMRPEISVLVKPIYPNLLDHSSVEERPNIRGVRHNIFLIDHQVNEAHNQDLVSKMNEHEARYISRLCYYLIQQEYKPSQITVLTPYSGQLHLLRKAMPKQKYEGVRICILDNFQGEENDIILLSIVRSNSEGSMGFMGIQNRICVALSRAKLGFFIIGNFGMLESNKTWASILELVGDVRGPALPLYCPNHPNGRGVDARVDTDFNKVPEGGCNLPCEYRLPCGHSCQLVCHPYDPEHSDIKCHKKCEKILCNNGHKCGKECHEECGDCQVLLCKTMPSCVKIPQHTVKVACSVDITEIPCVYPCTHVLPCGHQCAEKCSSPHTQFCDTLVEKQLPCGHKSNAPCCTNIEDIGCWTPCLNIMECSHQCSGDCTECLQGKMHVGCSQRCERHLMCGHQCSSVCNINCPPCRESCQRRCKHSKCRKKCGDRCVPCKGKCMWKCKHFKCTRLCHEPCDRPRCNKPCRKRLKCRHRCIGLCGEPCPRLCRVCDREKLREIFFGTEDDNDALFVELEDCKHVLEVTGLDRWIDEISAEKSASVQPRVCPLCKTPICRNMRYGNIIKSVSNDMDAIKRKTLAHHANLKYNRGALRELLRDTCKQDLDSFSQEWQELISRVGKNNKYISSQNYADIQNVCRTLQALTKMHSEAKKNLRSSQHLDVVMKHIIALDAWLRNRPGRLGFGQGAPLETEWNRLHLLMKYCQLDECLGGCDDASYRERAKEGLKKLLSGSYQPQKELDNLEVTYELVKKSCSGLAVTEKEKLEIVKAVGLGKGCWFKCPNGHFYTIGECSGATHESKCTDCGAAIGGVRHTLPSDNASAPEMDGATHAT